MADSELATYAVVVDGLCVNIIVWDGNTAYHPGDDAELVKLEDGGPGGIGWTYNPKATKNKWIAPPQPEEPTDGAD